MSQEENGVVTIDGKDVSAEELADIVWLAAHIWQSWRASAPPPATQAGQLQEETERGSPGEEKETGHEADEQATGEQDDLPGAGQPVTAGAPSLQEENKRQGQEVTEEAPAALRLPDPDQTAESSGLSFYVPSARALPQELALARSLRPLMRHVASPTEQELDETASAEKSAETSSPVIVLRPRPRRWLDLAVVIDESPSMLMWHRTIAEFLDLLRFSGAFRNLHLYGVRAADAGAVARGDLAGSEPRAGSELRLHTTSGAGWKDGRICKPLELLDPRGERVILVISDTDSPAWLDGRLPRMLQRWAAKGPVSILHMLPRPMWTATALVNELDVRLSNNAPGVPNNKLRVVKRPWYWLDQPLPKQSPVPVITLEPHSLYSWSKFVAGKVSEEVFGYYFLPELDEAAGAELGLELQASAESGLPESVDDLFEHYWRLLSPEARELASYLAACPVNLQVIALVQHLMMRDRAQQVHVAELIYGGLLLPTNAAGGTTTPDEVIYHFRGGRPMRSAWLSTARRDDVLQVFNAISDYVDSRAGSGAGFKALLYARPDQDTVTLDDLGYTLAEVAPDILRSLGGSYAELAGQLQRRVWREARHEAEEPQAPVELSAAEGGLQTTAAVTEPVERAAFPGYALLIAPYQTGGASGDSEARAAELAVNHLRNMLIDPQLGGYKEDRVQALAGERATGGNIQAGINWLLRRLELDPKASGFIYYSGRSSRDSATGQVLLEASPGPNDGVAPSLWSIDAAPLQEARFAGLAVALECGYADEIGRDLYEAAIGRESSVAGERKLVVWCAAEGSQQAHTHPQGGLRLFTYALLEALSGLAYFAPDDKTLNSKAVWDQLQKSLTEEARSAGITQDPVLHGSATFPIAAVGEKTKMFKERGLSLLHSLSVTGGAAKLIVVASKPSTTTIELTVRNSGVAKWPAGASFLLVTTIEAVSLVEANASTIDALDLTLPELGAGEEAQIELAISLPQGIGNYLLELRPILPDGRLFAFSEPTQVRLIFVNGSKVSDPLQNIVVSEKRNLETGSESEEWRGAGDLTSSGNSAINGASVIGRDLYISGDLNVNGLLYVSRNAYVEGRLFLNAPMFVGHNLYVEGDIFGSAPLAILHNFYVEGNLYYQNVFVRHNLTVEGAMRPMRAYQEIAPGEAEARLDELPLTTPPPLASLPDNAYCPVARSDLFSGRLAELQQIAAAVRSGGSEAVTVALLGAAGAGKSALAAEFVHRYGQFFPGGVFWISASSTAVIESEMVRCGGQEGLALPGFELLDFQNQLQRVSAAWASELPRLLIFDNCDNLQTLEPYLPAEGGCRVLLTSREPALSAAAHTTVHLSNFSLAEGVAFLRQLLPSISDEEAQQIVGLVNGHPHSLKLAGRYLQTRDDPGAITQYIARFEQALEQSRLSGRAADEDSGEAVHQRAVFTISWDQLYEPDGGPTFARLVLQQLVQFAPGSPFALALLHRALSSNDDAFALLRERTVGDILWEQATGDAVRELDELGLVDLSEAAATVVVQSHVAALVQENTPPGSSAERAAEKMVLEELAPVSGFQSSALLQLRRWQEHIKFVTDRAMARSDGAALALCSAYGRYLTAEGLYDRALAYFVSAADILQGMKQPDRLALAALFNEVGSVMQFAARFEEARSYFERALKIRIEELGEENPQTAETLNNLGALAQTLGENAQAQKYYERAFTVRERLLGTDHPDTAQTANNLGLIMRSRGDYGAARRYFELALHAREEVYGMVHPATAQSVSNLGSLYQVEGDLEQARDYHQRALDISESIFGAEHLEVAAALINLGRDYQLLGQYAQSLQMFTRALEINRRMLGEEHPDTAAAYDSLAGAYDSMGEYEEALPLYRRSLDSLQRVFGDDHPDVAAALSNLAGVYESLAQYDQALPLYRQALQICERVFGQEHPTTAALINNLARLYSLQEEYEQALELYERALETRRRVLGPDHPDTAATLNNMGAIYIASGQYERARDFLDEALAIRRRALGPRHPDTAASLNNLARLYRATGDYTRALDSFREALEIRREVLGSDHTDTASTEYHMARVYQLEGEYQHALPLYEHALTVFREKLGAQHPDTRRAQQFLEEARKELAHAERAPVGAQLQTFSHGYALIIGVDESLIPELALPVVSNDVSALYQVLVHPQRCAYLPDNVRLLKGENATWTNIIESWFWLREKADADPQATLFLYYAGHGVRSMVDGGYFLLPYDFSSPRRLQDSSIAVEEFLGAGDDIPAQRILAIFDCCHALNGDIEESVWEKRMAMERLAFPDELLATLDIPAPGLSQTADSDLADGEGFAFMSSSAGAQTSQLRRDGLLSVFMYHLIEALTGHAPHDDDDSVVSVTDLLSWTARQLRKAASQFGFSQTPVFRSSGVFPVGMLLGGRGVKVSRGDRPPDPLDRLPEEVDTVETEGTVAGTVPGEKEGSVHIGGQQDYGDTVQGDKREVYTGGDYVGGDKVGGDRVGGDKISVGNISQSTVAIGRGASASYQQGLSGAEIEMLFAPLAAAVQQARPENRSEAQDKLQQLRAEVAKGSGADDSRMARLIDSIAKLAPAAAGAVVSVFASPVLGGIAGPVTQFMLDQLREE